MSTEKSESLNFYTYLSQKIGSEHVVRFRRLNATISDLGHYEYGIARSITSGSRGEGLQLKQSDLDMMNINTFFKVYESETEVVHQSEVNVPLIMNTEDTGPCFAQLCLLNHPDYHYISTVGLMNMWQNNHLGCVLSSEQYRSMFFSINAYNPFKFLFKIHGPCLSDKYDELDILDSIKCDQWIFQARPWVSRPRAMWPPPELVSKIISCGVLFVPIGCKGSANENLEWRISFSVAEKFLIFSFSHTQLLCYALLKILLKEIVEKHEDLKGLLCSYFLKTLMFWISEETDPNLWRPDNIIPCFMACLQRLMYCVRYSILSHYFIPDNNLFSLRFNVMNKESMTTILLKLYEQGINCFASSETLQDYQSQSNEIPESVISWSIKQQITATFSINHVSNIKSLLYLFLRQSRTCICKNIFASKLSEAFMRAPQNISKCHYGSENKHQYFKYKYDLSHLLIGLQFDAVSEWLKLGSFLYVHKNYLGSLTVLYYTLQKFTDEKIFMVSLESENTLNHIQKHVLNLMKNEKIYTVLRALMINPICFHMNSSIIPQELQPGIEDIIESFPPLPFAHFLSFLCYYHLNDITSCNQHLLQLRCCQPTTTACGNRVNQLEFMNQRLILCGISLQLMGYTNYARDAFKLAAKSDLHNLSAASRLLTCYSS